MFFEATPIKFLKMREKSRLAVWGFCILQVILEIFIISTLFRGQTAGLPANFNFQISKWYIKK